MSNLLKENGFSSLGKIQGVKLDFYGKSGKNPEKYPEKFLFGFENENPKFVGVSSKTFSISRFKKLKNFFPKNLSDFSCVQVVVFDSSDSVPFDFGSKDFEYSENFPDSEILKFSQFVKLLQKSL